MARKLSRRSQQRIAKNMALIENINVLLCSITEEAITDFVRRDAIGVGHDGYPSDSMPEHSGGGFAGSSTESAALFGLPGAKGGTDDWNKAAQRRGGADVVRKQLASIEASLRNANKALREAAYQITNLNEKTEKVRNRQTSNPCELCGIDAAQKSGWCIKDYKEWNAAGRPDRARWTLWYRQTTNSEGVLLVPDQPQGT